MHDLHTAGACCFWSVQQIFERMELGVYITVDFVDAEDLWTCHGLSSESAYNYCWLSELQYLPSVSVRIYSPFICDF